MKKNIFKLITFLSSRLVGLLNGFIRLLNKWGGTPRLQILIIERNSAGRFLIVTLQNLHLLTGREFLEALYRTIMESSEINSFAPNKIIITASLNGREERSVHHNVLLKSNSTFEDYYNQVKDVFENISHGYNTEDMMTFYKVRIWNLDHLENKNIVFNHQFKSSSVKKIKISNVRGYITSSYIKPFKVRNTDLNTPAKFISTMDIETISYKGVQTPIVISVAYNANRSNLFLINKTLLLEDEEKAVLDLFTRYLDFATENGDYFEDNFAHNLGSFDGYFLYKNISKNCWTS